MEHLGSSQAQFPHPRSTDDPTAKSPVARVLQLVGTWLLLALGTLTATPVMPSAVWNRVITSLRHRHA